MKVSPHNGRKITFNGVGRLKHSGIIVGQTENGRTLFVRSDNPHVPPAVYHFSIPLDLLEELSIAAPDDKPLTVKKSKTGRHER